MSETDSDTTGSRKAAGVSFFGGILLVIGGLLQLLQGIAAVRNDELYVETPQYVYELDLTLWGWIQLFTGVFSVAVGVAIVASRPWGFFAGMFVLALSILTQFVFLPYYPLWGLTVIALDVAVMWALCTRLREDWTIP
jgi:hypothetical protein